MTDTVRLTEEQAELFATWFHSLADPTRMRILNLLASGEREMNVGDIVAALGLKQSTTSHHLKVLHDVGFVLRRREGTQTYHSVNRSCLERFPTAADMVMGRFRARSEAVSPGWLAG